MGSHNVEDLKKIRAEVEAINRLNCVVNAEKKLETIYTSCMSENEGHIVHLLQF